MHFYSITMNVGSGPLFEFNALEKEKIKALSSFVEEKGAGFYI